MVLGRVFLLLFVQFAVLNILWDAGLFEERISPLLRLRFGK